MHHYNETYIAGAWRQTTLGSSIQLQDTYSGEPLASVSLGKASDVTAAVKAAREASDEWAATPVARRAALLRKVADHLGEKIDLIAREVTREVGMPLKLSKLIQIEAPVKAWRSYADLAERFEFDVVVGNSLVTRVPKGVIACITPWNYPLHQITAKVAPALAAGCTVVLKPSELAPCTAYALAHAIHAAGFPSGVFNLIMGEGSIVGEALVQAPDVDMVSFTGSTQAGRRVAALAGASIKRVALELGGKSASVVLPDADLGRAVKHALGSCFLNSGQTCNAISRLLVPEQSYDQCVALLRENISKFTMGDPCDSGTRLGPLVSPVQRDNVKHHIEAALAEGAEIIAGGEEIPKGTGYFVAPTVLGKVGSTHRVAQEEIFGPVLSVLTYQNEEEAIRIANGTQYGLAAAVWSEDLQHAVSVARRLRAGQVDINGAPFNPSAPFGGFKESGVGRENGRYGFEEFLETSAIQVDTNFLGTLGLRETF